MTRRSAVALATLVTTLGAAGSRDEAPSPSAASARKGRCQLPLDNDVVGLE